LGYSILAIGAKTVMFQNASMKVLGRTFQINVYPVSSDFGGAVSWVSCSFPAEHWHPIKVVTYTMHHDLEIRQQLQHI
jgi:hypothetical protein